MDQPTPNNTGKSQYVSSIVLDIILTIITCGIYYFFIQYRQIGALNVMLGQNKYSFGKWLGFSLITCGIYHIFHEYKMAGDINSVVQDKSPNFQTTVLILSIFGLPIIGDAIMQDKINKHFDFDKV